MSAAAAASASRATVRTAPRRSAVWALARVEGRRLLRHPIFLVGMALTTVTLVLASGEPMRHGLAIGAHDRAEALSMLAGDCFVMLGAAFWTFLAAFLATSRERRDAAQELYAGQPVAQPARTAAAFLSLGWAGLAAAVLIGVVTLLFLGTDGTITTASHVYTVRPLELAQGPLYVVMAGALGVLLGSYTRHISIGVLAAVVLFLPPMALAPWFVFGDDQSRGFLGAVLTGAPLGWHLLAIAGLTAVAAALAVGRHDQRFGVALLGGAGLGAIVAVAIAAPSPAFEACIARPEVPAMAAGLAAPSSTANLDFESGDLSGWGTSTRGDGAWRVYPGRGERPAPTGGFPGAVAELVGPPQGLFAAISDPCGPGARILYRDLRLDGRRELRFALFYSSAAPLASSPTLDLDMAAENQQLRVDVMDPAAPVDSLDARDILATIFRTKPGDTVALGPKSMTFDLSRWADRTVRLRFATVDNRGPLTAIVDDVHLVRGR